MNYIEVTGGTAKQRAHVDSLVGYCIDKLGMSRFKTLDITVKLTTKGMGDADGLCCAIDDREFEIEVNPKLRLRRMLETVAHEMVHVKQYARRELHPSKEVWMGKTYNPKKTSYWDLPWEIEAHGREVGLFVRYCEENNLAKHKWTQL